MHYVIVRAIWWTVTDHQWFTDHNLKNTDLGQCFSTSGPRPGTGTWHQLYRAAVSQRLRTTVLDYITSNSRISDQLERILKELSWRYRSISRIFPEGTEKNYKSNSKVSWYPGRNSNRASPEYESSKVLPLHQSSRWQRLSIYASYK
jgi:hypothetical protein